MRLILVRHGQTVCNTAQIWHGWDDCELTALGQKQAKAVARRFAGERLHAIYSSSSKRAMQTAEILAECHRIVPVPSAELRERFAGSYEGQVVDAVVSSRPTIWQERDADPWNWRPPGGESFKEVRSRCLSAIQKIREALSTGTTAIVTHMGPARVLTSEFAGIPLAETYTMTFPSTGVSVFHLASGVSRVEVLNDASHIED